MAVIVDVGQEADFDVLGARAKAAGAVEVVVVDAREELLADIAMPLSLIHISSSQSRPRPPVT